MILVTQLEIFKVVFDAILYIGGEHRTHMDWREIREIWKSSRSKFSVHHPKLQALVTAIAFVVEHQILRFRTIMRLLLKRVSLRNTGLIIRIHLRHHLRGGI